MHLCQNPSRFGLREEVVDLGRGTPESDVDESLYWSAIIVGFWRFSCPPSCFGSRDASDRSARTSAKSSVYECGIIPEVDARRRFSVKFYLVAILFVVFDIEVAFPDPVGGRFP